ncbi:hypothetical protein BaRGS_00024023 [Batillaria attramentaria]|uniref:C2H2-type domain-containing protein n=1 Tax=Batillaria attramentaria TaxID=370345 RepID=A0ABD0KCA4_9CAEN
MLTARQGLQVQGLLGTTALGESSQFQPHCLHSNTDSLRIPHFMHPFSHHAGFLADHSPAVQSQLNLNCCPQIGKLPQNYELALGNDLKMQERVASGLVENPMASSGQFMSLSRHGLFSVESDLLRMGKDITSVGPHSFSAPPLKTVTTFGNAQSHPRQLFAGGLHKQKQFLDRGYGEASFVPSTVPTPRAFSDASEKIQGDHLAKVKGGEFHWLSRQKTSSHHMYHLCGSKNGDKGVTEKDMQAGKQTGTSDVQCGGNRVQNKDPLAVRMAFGVGALPVLDTAAGAQQSRFSARGPCAQTSASTYLTSSSVQSSADSKMYQTLRHATTTLSSGAPDPAATSSKSQPLAHARKQGKPHLETSQRLSRVKPYLKRRFKPQRQFLRGPYQTSALSSRMSSRGDASGRPVSGHAASSSRALPRQRTASQQGGEDVRKTFGSARPHHPGVVLDGVEDIRKSFRCPQCRYLTDRKNNLKRHIVTMHHTSTRVLECCGALFSSKASLRDHVTLFHRGGYRCQVCGRNFCRKALLRRHLTVHSGQKDFACHLCGYATSHKSNLERHQRVHARKSDVIAPEPILPEYEFQYVEEQRQRNIFRAERENSDQAQQFNQKPLKKYECDKITMDKLKLNHPYDSSSRSATSDVPAKPAESRAVTHQNFPGLDSNTLSETSPGPNAIEFDGNAKENEQPSPHLFCPEGEKFDQGHADSSANQPDGSRPSPSCGRGQSRQFYLPDRLRETHTDSNYGLKDHCITSILSTKDTSTRTGKPLKTSVTEDDDLMTSTKENENPSNIRDATEKPREALVSLKTKTEALQNSLDGRLREGVELDALSGKEDQNEHLANGRRPLQVSRRRMCCRPYRCFGCSASFSRQAELQNHICHDDVSDKGLTQFSVTSAVRKGCIETCEGFQASL